MTNMADDSVHLTENEKKIHKFADTFKSFNNKEKTLAIQTILSLCGPEQLRLLSEQLPIIARRDFFRYLPAEVSIHVLKYLDYKTISQCLLVSKTWNKILSSHSKIWIRACKSIGVVKQEFLHKTTTNLKYELKRGIRRLQKLRSHEQAFKTKILTGHEQRITALHYNKGFLASGAEDRTVRLWDVISNECKFNITCHTSTQLKFDENHIYTASCDQTLAKWEWSTGNCVRRYVGHVGAVFCLDYNINFDLLMSGASDCTVKFWQLSTGRCLATKTGHETWLVEVLFSVLSENSLTTLKERNVAISLSKDCIKVWSTKMAKEFSCVATLSNTVRGLEDTIFHPKLFCNGHHVICSSNHGVLSWDLVTLQPTWKLRDYNFILIASGELFSLCWMLDNFHIVNNSKEISIVDIRTEWSKPRIGHRFTDCAGEIDWLSNCREECERGPIYIGKCKEKIIILEWQ